MHTTVHHRHLLYDYLSNCKYCESSEAGATSRRVLPRDRLMSWERLGDCNADSSRREIQRMPAHEILHAATPHAQAILLGLSSCVVKRERVGGGRRKGCTEEGDPNNVSLVYRTGTEANPHSQSHRFTAACITWPFSRHSCFAPPPGSSAPQLPGAPQTPPQGPRQLGSSNTAPASLVTAPSSPPQPCRQQPTPSSTWARHRPSSPPRQGEGGEA